MADKTLKKISFVIPCYGSENTIENVTAEIFRALENSKYACEVILVNDASPDKVWEKITGLTKKYKNITGLKLAKNFGQYCALMAGYARATGDAVVSIDDDGQCSPLEVFKLIDKLNEGYDVVFAAYKHKRHNLLRNIGSVLNNFMAEILIGKPRGMQVMISYYIARKFVIDEILKYKGPYVYPVGLLLRTTGRLADVRVEHQERKSGRSGYSFRKLFELWLNGFTAFSIKPLRLASLLGFALSVVGFLYTAWILVEKFLDPNMVAGYSSIMAAVIFIGGVTMAMLGIIGEYIGRIYISINNAPQYVVSEIISGEADG
ncbi:MAG: glycosyltransferase [Candidatus Margulisbacteria bacterium]|jgi:undecaprenyl-phosphate 4-deoxy-4-formamido-L-arabinose transferase|nr:glycosyltransferase [Candidatus Margulisiibacteriota bacterium]